MRLALKQGLIIFSAVVLAGCVASSPPAGKKTANLFPVMPARTCTSTFAHSSVVLDALNASAGKAHGVPGTVQTVKDVAPAKKTELARLNLHVPSGANAFACTATLKLTSGAKAHGLFYIYKSQKTRGRLAALWVPEKILKAAYSGGGTLASPNVRESRAYAENANLCFMQWHIASIVRTQQESGWSERRTQRYVVRKYAKAHRPGALLSHQAVRQLVRRITSQMYSAAGRPHQAATPDYSSKQFLLKCMRRVRR